MNKTLQIKAVIFDRDGVIINTEGLVIETAKKAFKKLGFQLQPEDIPEMIGKSPRVYTEYFLKKWKFDPDEYRKIQSDLFYKNIDSVPFFEDALALVKYLHEKKIPIAITTSAGREGTLLILNKAKIDTLFDAIVTREDCTNLKPHPEPYLRTSEKLGIKPEYCVVIEDTALGVESAKKAGMRCIAVPNEYTSDQDFSLADAVVQSAKEIESMLEFI
jgi:beta-phosphoglucomutase